MLPAWETRTQLLVFAAAAGLMLVLKDYHLFKGTMLMSYALALIGLNILTGCNGQISLGHGAFYAIGAYATAIGIERFGVPYGIMVPCAGVIAMACGYLFGLPALRLEGHHLALATFTLSVVVPQLLKWRHIQDWTGGAQGLTLSKPDAPFGLPLSQDQWLYTVSLALTTVMFFLARNLMVSGAGRAILAIRDRAVAAAAVGIDGASYKARTFGISALYTGLGGAISALAIQFVAPDSYTMFLSISLLVGIVVGGIGSVWGAFIGAAFILFVPDVAESISKSAPWAVYGAVLILVMFVMPTGVAGASRQAWIRLRRPGAKADAVVEAEPADALRPPA